ncbi:MAG TPA: hypothetical protein VHL85_13280 [Burkholderiales bacterium]|jgi:hypothetical protein|nr:hypothetical protein [Burkholderiales bacterium]
MSEPGAPIARFDFSGGSLRGSHLTLYASCLVHQGAGLLETLPLASIASVRVAFERDERRIRWAIGLLVLAVVLLVLAGPLESYAAKAAAQMAAGGGQGVSGLLEGVFGVFEALGRLLPAAAALVALGAIALGAFGWLGTTRLTVAFAGYERDYPARGRDTKLLDFTELLAAQVVSVTR